MRDIDAQKKKTGHVETWHFECICFEKPIYGLKCEKKKKGHQSNLLKDIPDTYVMAKYISATFAALQA